MKNKLKLKLINNKLQKLKKKEEKLIYKKNNIKNYIDIEKMKEK